MRRQFIPQAAEGGRGVVFALAAQLAHFAQQQVDLVLLFGHQGVEGVEQVFGVADLDFQLLDALGPLFGGVVGWGGVGWGGVAHEARVLACGRRSSDPYSSARKLSARSSM
jgi:hypothetical protein